MSVAVRNPSRRYEIGLAEADWTKTAGYLHCDPLVAGPAPEERHLEVTRAGPFVRLHEEGAAARDFASVADLRDHLHARFFIESMAGSLPLLHAACLVRGGRGCCCRGRKMPANRRSHWRWRWPAMRSRAMKMCLSAWPG